MRALSLGQLLTPLQPKTPQITSARSRNRAAAAWQYDLAKWRDWRLCNAGTEMQRATVEAEYEKQLAAGPDFTSYRQGSSFAEPPRHDLTREDRIRILTAFDGIRSGLYRHCRRDRGQAVSRAYRDVLGILLSYAVRRSRVFPCLATIARGAMCSVRTVLNALAWLELYGFLARLRRIVRAPGLLGPRVRQTSNAYALRWPTGLGAIGARMFGVRAPDGNNCQPSTERGKEEALREENAAAEAAPAGLLAALERLRASVARASAAG